MRGRGVDIQDTNESFRNPDTIALCSAKIVFMCDIDCKKPRVRVGEARQSTCVRIQNVPECSGNLGCDCIQVLGVLEQISVVCESTVRVRQQPFSVRLAGHSEATVLTRP